MIDAAQKEARCGAIYVQLHCIVPIIFIGEILRVNELEIFPTGNKYGN
jgi:hypothetical protein